MGEGPVVVTPLAAGLADRAEQGRHPLLAAHPVLLLFEQPKDQNPQVTIPSKQSIDRQFHQT